AVSGVRSIGFPGNDPGVTTVGGTSLGGDANGLWKYETGWSGSGGGLSLMFARPAWQTGPGVSNTYSTGNRQTPDIAAMADPSSPGYRVYWRGSWSGIGGTSGATPLWAAANLLINQGGGQRTGSLNPYLYAIGAQLNDAPNIFVFHDMVTGSNGYYPCTP